MVWWQIDSGPPATTCCVNCDHMSTQLFSCDQAALRTLLSARPSVRHNFLIMFPSTYHHEIFRSYYHRQKWCPCKRSRSKVKGQGLRGQNKFCPNLGVSEPWLQFEFTDGYDMMHKAWTSKEKLPYCFSRSSVKFQGHTRQKIADFDPSWVSPDCNSSLYHQWLRNDAQRLK